MQRMMTAALALCFSITALPASAQTPDGERVLKDMAAHFRNLEQFKVDVNVDVHIDMQGQRQNSSASINAAVHKPDRFRLAFTSEGTTGLTVNDGEQTTTFIPSIKQYMVQDTDADAPLDHEMMGVLLNGALVAADPYGAMTRGAQQITYQQQATVGEREVDVVRMVTPEGVVDVHVTQGDKPVPVKVVVDQTPMLQAAGRDGSVKVTMTYDNWTVDEALDEALFKFEAPEGVKQVSQFREPQASDALVGNAAPAVKLETLDGGQFTLDEAKGKIVVLDFWATWCGPCIRAMPLIKQAVADFDSDQVVLYMVNQRESEDKINAFLQKHEMADLNVLLDRNAEVARAYQVRGIPQTVVIDASGVVQAVHVGFSPQIGDQLKSELQTLAKGESLVD